MELDEGREVQQREEKCKTKREKTAEVLLEEVERLKTIERFKGFKIFMLKI